MPLTTAQLLPGDIIIYRFVNPVAVAQGALKAISYALVIPAIVKAARGRHPWDGAATSVHAGIFVNGMIHPVHTHARSGMIHVVNGGPAYATPTVIGNIGDYQAFRLNVATLANVPQDASDVAVKWYNEALVNPLGYSQSKAIRSVFRSDTLGVRAQARVTKYANAAVNSSLHGQNFNSMFCTEFVIACYQSVMQQADIATDLPVNAKYAEPMSLHGFFKNSASWDCVGKSWT